MGSRSLGVLSLDLIAKTGGFEAGMDKAARVADKRLREIERQAQARAKAIEKAFDGMARSIAAPFAASLGVTAFAGLIKGAIDAQDNLKDLSKSTSISIEDLAGLSSAALKSGSDLDSIADSINKLSVNMGKEPEKFRAIGVSAKDPLEAFKQLADVFKAIQDPQERAAFAAEALGKSWKGAAPLLSEGSKAIGEMVDKGKQLSKVTEESAAKADELNDLLVDLKSSGNSVALEFANLLVPSLTDTAKAMDDLAGKGNPVLALLRGFAGLGKLPFDLAFGNIDTSVTAQIQDLEAELGNLKSKRDKLAGTGGGLINEWVFGNKDDLDQKILVATNQLEALKKYGDVFKKKPVEDSTETPAPNIRSFLGDKEKAPKAAKKSKTENYIDPLTESAKLYESALKALDQAQLSVDASGLGLTATQTELMKVMSSPLFQQMPEAWKATITAQAEYVVQAEKTAEAQKRLNDLLSATPTEQLERQRETMQFLAQAFESGRISADQFSEAASTALGNIPAQAEPAKDSFLDLTTVANDAARSMADGFTNYLFDPMNNSIKDMLVNFLKATAKMIAQAAMLNVVKAGMSAMGFSGFAKGGAFDGGVQAFASGGVVNTATPFRFASGGSFKNGVMGEAGPEAIMPLKRGSDGKLGVTLNGGGTSSPVVNITVNQNGDSQKEDSNGSGGARELANRIKGAVLDVITNEKRPGGLLYA